MTLFPWQHTKVWFMLIIIRTISYSWVGGVSVDKGPQVPLLWLGPDPQKHHCEAVAAARKPVTAKLFNAAQIGCDQFQSDRKKSERRARAVFSFAKIPSVIIKIKLIKLFWLKTVKQNRLNHHLQIWKPGNFNDPVWLIISQSGCVHADRGTQTAAQVVWTAVEGPGAQPDVCVWRALRCNEMRWDERKPQRGEIINPEKIKMQRSGW